MSFEHDVGVDQRFGTDIDAEEQGQARRLFHVEDLARDREIGDAVVDFQFGRAHFRVGGARVGFELGVSALRQRLGIRGETRRHIDSDALERFFRDPSRA